MTSDHDNSYRQDYPMVSSLSLSCFGEIMAAEGVDGDALMRRHHLNPNVVSMPHSMVRYDSLASLLSDAAEQSGCTHLGLLLADTMPVESIDLVLVCAQSETLREALLNIERYRNIFGQGFNFVLQEVGDTAYWKYLHTAGGANDYGVLSDVAALVLLKILRMICGDSKVPIKRVCFDHYEAEDVTVYRKFFGVPCEFNRDFVGLEFSAQKLDQQLPNNERLREILFSYVEQRILTERQEHLGEKVSCLINMLLPIGRCSIENVADMLGMHRRTLQKKLTKESIVFKALLRKQRIQKACYCLKQTNLSVAEIALSIGYSDTANFLHAFKRWKGMTPLNWRKMSRQSISHGEEMFCD